MNECDMNFIVQSLACMISIHNILTSYADDFYFQNNQDTFITSSNHRLKKCVRVLVGWNSNF